MVLVILVSACAHRDHQELTTIYDRNWFNTNTEHSLRDPEGKPLPHLFFDVDPQFVKSDRSANVIIVTPYRSPNAYSLDLPSGQRYFTHSYCSQKDVWKKESGLFGPPHFSIAYLPRVLDQLGNPHRVIVFGNAKREQPLLDINYMRVRMVGAYVENICPEGNCVDRNTWLSRLVFIAVDAADHDYDSVNSLKSFKRKVKWETIKPELENMDGRNPYGEFVTPAVRVRKLLSFNTSFDYFQKRSILFTTEEMKKVQLGCHRLYEKFWTEVGAERPDDAIAKSTLDLEAKLKAREESRRKKLPVGFAARFRQFISTYYSEMKTCEKFVYHGNINSNPDKFWFLSYMGIFLRLHADGYYFDCSRDAWTRNEISTDGKPQYNFLEEIYECSERDIDLAMKNLPTFLKEINRTETRKYRFVDYDMHPFGTHQKIYNWTHYKLNQFECSDNKNENMLEKLSIMPEEAPWLKREPTDKAYNSKIIY
jgi:hypothetical protein